MGEAPGRVAKRGSGSRKRPAASNGAYRFSISKEEAIAAGAGDDPDYPTVANHLVGGRELDDGGARGSQPRRPLRGRTGTEISFESPLDDVIDTSTFTRDEAGNLTLEPLSPWTPATASL